ncbi:MAG: hypothetical protein CDV28_11738 [Candidatus Electronema aureum]|uniref:Uncharacterized protein n=1 Tax=Candidatus Electronema aureum TaxID=2005002 RepID=A0A521G1B3_9BACT|nr:MAG: hypothetical protein CDV28_11738 [Candidatus Electronema aureum]
MLNPGETAPLISGGTALKAYECGEYQAVLVRDPESFGPIQYLYLLVIYQKKDNSSPIMYITAEQSILSPAFMKIAADQLGQNFEEDAGYDIFLCVFDESGHANLDSSNEYAKLEVFEANALAVMRKILHLTANVYVTKDLISDKYSVFTRLSNSLFGILKKKPTKESLIRELVKQRLANDPNFAKSFNVSPAVIDSMPIEVIMGLPESTIFSIVESWAQCLNKNISPMRILQLIEAHRCRAAEGEMPYSLSLEVYIQYRVNLEHSEGASISDAHIDHCIYQARKFYKCK